MRENSKKLKSIIAVGVFVSFMMVVMVINNYTQLRDALILNEQKHLLTIVETTAKSIENHFIAEERSLELLSKDLRFIENFKKLENNKEKYKKDELKYYYKAAYPSIKNIQLLDAKGNLLSEYPENHSGDLEIQRQDIKSAVTEKVFQISAAHFVDGKPYVYLLQPIIIGDNVDGVIKVKLNIENLYNSFIKQIKSGEKGYASVKDEDGVFLMHPVENQIGKTNIELRKKTKPDYDWSELKELFSDQKKNKNGTKIYHSTWVGDDDFEIIKKFNAYATLELQDNHWIVTLSTDYNEVVDRIKKNYYMTILISSMIVLSFVFILIYMYVLREKERKLEIRSDYLKQLEVLNEKLEEDIEKRKRLEKKLLKTMEENKKKEAIMIHQSRQAAMGEMVGNIAHQWRQPLSSLSLLISNIEDMMLYGEEDKKYLEEVFERSRFIVGKMSETIDDFRNFFKPKSKKETFSIKKMIEITENICSERLKHNNITLEADNCSEAFITGYFNQLCQVMLNIVNNGIDAIAEGSSDGKIGIRVEENEEKDVQILVEDSGGGIPTDIIGRVFEPYFSTKDEKNGTGIGLHMSKIIIEKNFNGEIKVVNGKKGAIFKVMIPR